MKTKRQWYNLVKKHPLETYYKKLDLNYFEMTLIQKLLSKELFKLICEHPNSGAQFRSQILLDKIDKLFKSKEIKNKIHQGHKEGLY